MIKTLTLPCIISAPHPCSYLPDRPAIMTYIHPQFDVSPSLFSDLSRLGFRRSGDIIYRPQCQGCQQCMSARLILAAFKPNRQQKRVLKRNQDIILKRRPIIALGAKHFELYARYIQTRHADGTMFPPTYEQFIDFLGLSAKSTGTKQNSFFLEFSLNQQLLAVAICDQLDDGIAAVYTFYEPSEANRSLGTYAILQQIAYAQLQQLPYIYLGYWVKDSPKMNYKAHYQPLEIFTGHDWMLFSDYVAQTAHLETNLPEQTHADYIFNN